MRRRDDERGATLLMALIFVLIFSVSLAIILDFENVSFKLTTVAHGKRAQQYAAEGAVDASIGKIRKQAVGFTDVACPTNTIRGTNDVDIRVDCAPSSLLLQSSHVGWPITHKRDLIFTACIDTGSPCAVADRLVVAEVIFIDAPATGSAATPTSWSSFK